MCTSAKIRSQIRILFSKHICIKFSPQELVNLHKNYLHDYEIKQWEIISRTWCKNRCQDKWVFILFDLATRGCSASATEIPTYIFKHFFINATSFRFLLIAQHENFNYCSTLQKLQFRKWFLLLARGHFFAMPVKIGIQWHAQVHDGVLTRQLLMWLISGFERSGARIFANNLAAFEHFFWPNRVGFGIP